MAATRSYYELLGVNKDSTTDEIKKAYQKKALLVHPDKNPSKEATEHMQLLNEAYETLSDPIKRALYDKEDNEEEAPANPSYNTHQHQNQYQYQYAPFSKNYSSHRSYSNWYHPQPNQHESSPFADRFANFHKEEEPQNPLFKELNELIHGFIKQSGANEENALKEIKRLILTLSDEDFNKSKNFTLTLDEENTRNRKKISVSLVFLLAANEKTLKLLLEEPDIRKKIMPEGLNEMKLFDLSNVSNLKYACFIHYSPLSFMAITKLGLQMLSNDASLREKITSEGLNNGYKKLDIFRTTFYEEKSHSPVHFPISISDSQLVIDESFIPNEGSLLYHWEEYFSLQVEGFSVLYWLTSTEEGLEILRKDQALRDKIEPQALNRSLKISRRNDRPESIAIDTGLSPAYWLAATKTGRRILYEDERLRKLMLKFDYYSFDKQFHSLNRVVKCKNAEHCNKTGAFWLLNTSDGQEIVDMNDGLLRRDILLKGKPIMKKIKWNPTKFYKPENTGAHEYKPPSKIEKIKKIFKL